MPDFKGGRNKGYQYRLTVDGKDESEDLRMIRFRKILHEFCSELHQRKPFINETFHLYQAIRKKMKSFKGRSLRYLAGAIIFLTSRLFTYNISLRLIAKKTGLKEFKLQKAFNFAKNLTPKYYNNQVAKSFVDTQLAKAKNEIRKNSVALGLKNNSTLLR